VGLAASKRHAGGEQDGGEREPRLQQRPIDTEDGRGEYRITKRADEAEAAQAVEFAHGCLEGHSKSVHGSPALVKAERIGAGNLSRFENDFRRAQVPPHSGVLKNAGRVENIQPWMARKRKKTELGSHQTGFIADSNID